METGEIGEGQRETISETSSTTETGGNLLENAGIEIREWIDIERQEQDSTREKIER